MIVFVTALHVFLCIILILVILLQPGKGGDVASAFGGGGGNSAVFGPRGPASLLNQATTIVAVLFMVTSILLAVNSTKQAQGSGTDLEDGLEQFEQEALEEGQGFGELPLPTEPTLTPDIAPPTPAVPPSEPAAPEGTEEPENTP